MTYWQQKYKQKDEVNYFYIHHLACEEELATENGAPAKSVVRCEMERMDDSMSLLKAWRDGVLPAAFWICPTTNNYGWGFRSVLCFQHILFVVRLQSKKTRDGWNSIMWWAMVFTIYVHRIMYSTHPYAFYQ